jgi:ABC-type amino acid transport system permease subunit
MNHLRLTSYAMTLLGLLLALIAAVADVGHAWMLAGILLAWAGIVKIAVVLIWTRIAHMGSDQHSPERGV